MIFTHDIKHTFWCPTLDFRTEYGRNSSQCYFSERELHVLRNRTKLDDPNKTVKKQHIGRDTFKQTVNNKGLLLPKVVALI